MRIGRYPGTWEGDLSRRPEDSYIATIVERQTRVPVLVKVDGKDTKTVVSALSEQMGKLPNLLQQSLTYDRGAELAANADFSVATNMDVYFCNPSIPWRRGTNENMNGLLRQCFPTGDSLSKFTQDDLIKVARNLITDPEKHLAYALQLRS